MTPTADIELVKGTPSLCSPLGALARGIQDVFQAEGEEEKRGEESGECFSRIDRYASQGQLGVLRDPGPPAVPPPQYRTTGTGMHCVHDETGDLYPAGLIIDALW